MNPKKLTLRGVFTALVTPMNRDGSVDEGALDQLVDAHGLYISNRLLQTVKAQLA